MRKGLIITIQRVNRTDDQKWQTGVIVTQGGLSQDRGPKTKGIQGIKKGEKT